MNTLSLRARRKALPEHPRSGLTLEQVSKPHGGSAYLPTLDGWRAIAIAMVMAVHAAPLTGRWTRLEQFRLQGTLGVDLFFAISGILICTRLLREEDRDGRITLKCFYIRRTCRIFPPACLFLYVLATLAVVRILPMDWPAWGSALVFLRNYFACFVRDTLNGRFTGHFWSLAIEEHFYLLLPSLVVFFPRHRKLVLGGLVVAAFFWLVLYLRITPALDRQLFWERRTDLRINSLLFPAFLAILLREERARRYIVRFTRPALLVSLLILLFIGQYVRHHRPTTDSTTPATAPAVAVPAPVPLQPWENFRKDPTLHVIAVFVVPYLFPFLILSTMLHPYTLPARVLEWTPLRILGRMSYSIYLWQQLFWVRGAKFYAAWPISHLQRPVPALLLTVACATASYFLVEKPFIRLGHRLTAKKPAPLLRPATSA